LGGKPGELMTSQMGILAKRARESGERATVGVRGRLQVVSDAAVAAGATTTTCLAFASSTAQRRGRAQKTLQSSREVKESLQRQGPTAMADARNALMEGLQLQFALHCRFVESLIMKRG